MTKLLAINSGFGFRHSFVIRYFVIRHSHNASRAFAVLQLLITLLMGKGMSMAWLFERMIETAAWVAFILGLVALCEAVYMLYQWFAYEPENAAVGSANAFLVNSGQAAAAFVLCALAMGALACIDRYVFDVDEHK